MKELKQIVYKKLRSSEQFFKTDMVYLARGSFWLSSGQLLTALSSFGLALLFARLVPKEIFGNYRYILSLAGLAATFTLTGISTAVVQSVARGYSGTFIKAVKVASRWNAIIFGLSIAGSIYYISKDNLTVGYSLIVIALLFPAIRTFEIYEAYLSGKKDFKKNALYRGIVDIGTIAATAIAIFFTKDAFLLVSVNLLTQFLLDLFFFRKVYNSVPQSERGLIENKIISFSKHMSLQNILTNAAAYIDKILIFHYLGAAEVAIYTFALALPQQIKALTSNISLVATPKISNRTAQEAVDTIPRRFFISLLVLGPIVILYIIFAPFLFNLLFPAYMDAVPYTRWYALILLILGNLSGLVLTTQKAVHEQYIINVFASGSQIILMLLLVHKYGIQGIIWAILLTKLFTAILSYILVKRFARKVIPIKNGIN